MAKAISSPIAKTAAPSADEWQMKDDADTIKRYADLRSNKSRHTKAMGHIRSTFKKIDSLDSDGDADMSSASERSTKRTTARPSGRKVSRA